MIKVEIKKDNITVSGHALYDDYGKDIVCASVSSIVITTVNAIMKIDDSSILCNQKDALISIRILNHNDTVDKLIENMLDLLRELERDYKKNIKIYE